MRAEATFGRGPGRYLARHIVHALLIAGLSVGLFWLVWIYGSGLRDPRYFDGWVLAGGMIAQLVFHASIKVRRLSPRSIARLRKVHIFTGYVLIAAFISHSDFSLPDSAFEWVLWTGFVLVTMSGVFGTYLAWSLKARRGIDNRVTYDQIPLRRAELARAVEALATKTDPDAVAANVTEQPRLPAQPYDAWIMDLYTNHLREFFEGSRNASAHLVGSERALKQLTDEIDGLSRYVDTAKKAKLATLKAQVIEKDRLDFASVHLGLTRGWLFVHVPVTYGLIVLAILHVIVSYAFSAGNW